MKIALLALYAGPDQIMVATSALATVLGFVLMLWSRLLGLFARVLKRFTRNSEAVELPRPDNLSDRN